MYYVILHCRIYSRNNQNHYMMCRRPTSSSTPAPNTTADNIRITHHLHHPPTTTTLSITNGSMFVSPSSMKITMRDPPSLLYCVAVALLVIGGITVIVPSSTNADHPPMGNHWKIQAWTKETNEYAKQYLWQDFLLQPAKKARLRSSSASAWLSNAWKSKKEAQRIKKLAQFIINGNVYAINVWLRERRKHGKPMFGTSCRDIIQYEGKSNALE